MQLVVFMAENWDTNTGLSKEDFIKFTKYCNDSNNPIDNRNRAVILGFTQEGTRVAPGANIRLGENGSIGKNVFVGLFSYINGDVVIEDNVLIGPHVCLTSNTHLFNTENQSFQGKNSNRPIRIGAGSWIAAGVIVTAGVTVGKSNVICANSVVTKNTPDYAIIAGTPGRVVGTIDPTTGSYNWLKNS